MTRANQGLVITRTAVALPLVTVVITTALRSLYAEVHLQISHQVNTAFRSVGGYKQIPDFAATMLCMTGRKVGRPWTDVHNMYIHVFKVKHCHFKKSIHTCLQDR